MTVVVPTILSPSRAISRTTSGSLRRRLSRSRSGIGRLAFSCGSSRPRASWTAGVSLVTASIRSEPVPYEEAIRGEFRQIDVGDPWGPPWSTTWIHVRGKVPDEWAGQDVVALFDLGFEGATGFTCEALAWKEGRPWRGVDPNHRRLPIDGPEVDFYLEAAANPTATEEGVEPAPSMITLRESP